MILPREYNPGCYCCYVSRGRIKARLTIPAVARAVVPLVGSLPYVWSGLVWSGLVCLHSLDQGHRGEVDAGP